MVNKKKIIIIVLVSIILLVTIYKTIAKYQSFTQSSADIDVAFFVTKTEFQSMNLHLDEIEPKSKPYVYKFTIANRDQNKRAETKQEYDLTIKTTTNLPLIYELYMNEEYTDLGAKSIIKENKVEQDEYGTYFRTITTDTQEFGFEKDEINTYSLIVYFPEEYKSIEYQDIIEGIEICVNSKQIIE